MTPQRLNYSAPKPRKRGRLPFYVWLWTAGGYSAAMLLPFVLIGETWAMVWFPLSVPLSAWAEDKWGIGSDTPFLILAITLANGAAVGAVVAGLVVVRRLRTLTR